MHDRALLRIRDAIASVTGDDKARRRLAVQVGTPRALDDLATLAGILANRDLLNDLARRLPNHMRSFEREQIDAVKAMLDAETAQKGHAGVPADKTDVFVYGFVLIMGRLAAPWQLIRIATRAAESDEVARDRRNALCGGGRHRDRRSRVHGERPACGTQSAPVGHVAAEKHS